MLVREKLTWLCNTRNKENVKKKKRRKIKTETNKDTTVWGARWPNVITQWYIWNKKKIIFSWNVQAHVRPNLISDVTTFIYFSIFQCHVHAPQVLRVCQLPINFGGQEGWHGADPAELPLYFTHWFLAQWTRRAKQSGRLLWAFQRERQRFLRWRPSCPDKLGLQ